MTSVLVTGANGQLGETIRELYKKNDLELNFIFVNKTELDITDKEALCSLFKENNFDYCINCAAYTNVEQAEKTPDIAYKINAEGVKNIANICKKNDAVLIHISTDYVFDGEKRKPYTIFDKTNPINEYGNSKLQGENYIKDILSKYFIIRTSWLYSKKYGNNFYKTILKKAKVEKELSITTDQKGCPTDTINLSKFIIKLICTNNISYGVFHFCDKIVMTWYDFAENILISNKLFDTIKLVKVNKYVTFAKRPKYSVLFTNTDL
ncbi:dTDP-4-dehydrorhamnose reductase [Hyunsoonleella sp. 2307UL5-6]|uniref:dTDP-4-dehydrorhamnose reductase n=1 Tax=Hyunsoonleella sp. 2307UL5-6 TaxID=3384768 RepID=UPI0039BC72F4